jgi:hypothetical protein
MKLQKNAFTKEYHIGPVKAIIDRSIMAFFKKNEDYLKISKIS